MAHSMWSAFYDKIMYLLFAISLSLSLLLRSLLAAAAAKTCSAFLSLHFVEAKRTNVDPKEKKFMEFYNLCFTEGRRERMFYMKAKLKPKNKKD